jgi:hypothetical protein
MSAEERMSALCHDHEQGHGRGHLECLQDLGGRGRSLIGRGGLVGEGSVGMKSGKEIHTRTMVLLASGSRANQDSNDAIKMLSVRFFKACSAQRFHRSMTSLGLSIRWCSSAFWCEGRRCHHYCRGFRPPASAQGRDYGSSGGVVSMIVLLVDSSSRSNP